MSTNAFLIRPRDKANPDAYLGYTEEDLLRLLNSLDMQRDAVANALEKRREMLPIQQERAA